MSRYNDELKLKLAWQTAYEQRTCPGSDVLYAETVDGNLRKHLSFCEVCRENRAMQLEEKTAWRGLLDKMSRKAIRPASDTPKQEGQVWTLKKTLGQWQKDGRYFQPPMVLLLSKIENMAAWRVAQLYEDKRLSGNGDVLLDDRFGFAESWNCYDLKETSLGLCLGCVKEEELERVITWSRVAYPPEPDGSICSLFRNIEIEVAASVASSNDLFEAASQEIIDLIPGLKLAINSAKYFVLDVTIETLELLRGTFKPALVLRGGTPKPPVAKLSDEHKKLIQDHCPVIPVDVKVTGDSLSVTLKWLGHKPAELPTVKVILNDVEVSAVSVNTVTTENITIKYGSFSLIQKSQIYKLRVEYVGEALKLDIYSEK